MGESTAREASWQELTKSECFELLAGQRVGRGRPDDGEVGPVGTEVRKEEFSDADYARFRAPHSGLFRVRFLSTHHLAQAFMDGAAIGSHEGGFLAWESEGLPVERQ